MAGATEADLIVNQHPNEGGLSFGYFFAWGDPGKLPIPTEMKTAHAADIGPAFSHLGRPSSALFRSQRSARYIPARWHQVPPTSAGEPVALWAFASAVPSVSRPPQPRTARRPVGGKHENSER